MPPVSSPAQASRQAFAARLRGIREFAGVTGRELAAAAGWHASKVSKIEHCVRPPSAEDVRMWAVHCGAEDQLDDLLAVLRTVDGMYVEFRGRERAGFRHMQVEGLQLYERTRHFRIYEPGVISRRVVVSDTVRLHLQGIR